MNLLNGLGWSLYRQRKYAQSEKSLLRAYEFAPLHGGILNGLRRVTFENRNYEDAKRFNEEYLKLNSNPTRLNVSAHVILGIIGILERNFSSADNHLRQAISIDSTYTRAYQHLGYVLAAQGRFSEAQAFCEKAISLDSSFASYNLLAWVLIAGELDIKQGVSFAEKALDSKPENWADQVDAYSYLAIPEHSLGLAYLKKGDHEKAVQYLEQAAEFQPDRQAIKDGLLMAMGKLEEINNK